MNTMIITLENVLPGDTLENGAVVSAVRVVGRETQLYTAETGRRIYLKMTSHTTILVQR